MAKIKAVKFHTDYCEEGEIKYPVGTVLAQTDEALRCVALNFAEIVSVDDKTVSDPVAEKAAAAAAAEKDAAIKAAQAVLDQAKSLAESTATTANDAHAAALAEQDETKKPDLIAAAQDAAEKAYAAELEVDAAAGALDALQNAQ